MGFQYEVLSVTDGIPTVCFNDRVTFHVLDLPTQESELRRVIQLARTQQTERFHVLTDIYQLYLTGINYSIYLFSYFNYFKLDCIIAEDKELPDLLVSEGIFDCLGEIFSSSDDPKVLVCTSYILFLKTFILFPFK